MKIRAGMFLSMNANDLYMKSGGSYSIVRSVHRDSVTSFNVSCENGDRHFLYTLLGADSFKLANQPPLAVIVCYSLTDIFKELKFGRPADDQKFLDKCIKKLG